VAWQPLPAAPPAHDLVVSPDGTLLAATDLGAVRSEDRGDTWIRSGCTLAPEARASSPALTEATPSAR